MKHVLCGPWSRLRYVLSRQREEGEGCRGYTPLKEGPYVERMTIAARFEEHFNRGLHLSYMRERAAFVAALAATQGVFRRPEGRQ